MSNAHSTNEGHIDKNGRKRRTKKDDRYQMPLFGDGDPPTPPDRRHENDVPPHAAWEKLSIRLNRKDDRTTVQVLVQNKRGQFRELEIITDYRQLMPLLIIAEELISRHWS